ncbi:pectinacetylesterase family protein [Paenibacillus sp. IHBB 10380]|uniref:pectinacetylesterase family protein n=1 Tax=Paenibacillus sp. IHBB 10380 TaxID=1566358 RepID=UPI000AE11A1F|nr:pectinacetylesterase family protein [Paenibacillus sp. IHBB 10380]
MRKLGKITKVFVISLLCVIIVSSVAIYAFAIKRPTTIPVMADTKPYKWNKVTLGEKVLSSDGSEYYLWTKKGENPNWIIFFSGGGVSWDAESASHPIKIMNFMTGRDTGNYFANIPFYMLTLLGGMLATDNPDNPFKEWNVVYIPYSTGDFHVGNNSAEYKKKNGSSFTMHYNGKNNVQSSLDWIYANVDKPDKLLIAGESAGGFGSAFWANTIAKHYNESEIYQYSDSSYLNSDKWPDIVKNEWHADFKQTFGFSPEADLIGSAVKANSHLLPANAVLLQSYSLFDEILIHFQNKINDYTGPFDQRNVADWSRQMRESTKALDSSIPNYYYYLTDYGLNAKTGTTPHTFATRETFYKAEQDGVKLLNWLDDIINKQKNYSVGHKFIEELDNGQD